MSRERTEQKLKYAIIHLEELKSYPNAKSNDEWENAHQESCFYHLAGVVEAVLHEINDGYSLGVEPKNVTWRRVREKFEETDVASPAFTYINNLRQPKDEIKTSWLAVLFEWRNHGTHRGRVGKYVFAPLDSGHNPDNEFKHPQTYEEQKIYPGLGCQAVLERLTEDVRKLIK